MDELNVDSILKIYETEISKGVKNKRKLYDFELNKMEYVNDIINMLNTKRVGHNRYNIFLIYEPKCRLVMSLPVKDKIINHFVSRNILEKNLTKYLVNRNVATRKDMGNDYAIKLVKSDLNSLKKGKEIYALKLDISKYFYTIDHNILKNMLCDKLSKKEFNIISKIIDSTNNLETLSTIEKTIKDKDLPKYQYGKGLPIGNMTSQFLSIFYLYKLDYFIIHNLKLKHYVRFMDDFIIFDNDLDKLYKAKNLIIDKLIKEYKLNINTKKTFIVNMKYGVSFLGYTFKVINNKTIIKVKKSSLDKIKKKLKHKRYLFNTNNISHYEAFCTIMTYTNSYKYTHNNKMKLLINRYWYNE